MILKYEPLRIEEKYKDIKWLQKKYNKEIANGMEKFLNFAKAAENAYDIKTMPSFYMEHLKGNMKDSYSISVDKKKSKWRLILQMLNNEEQVVCPGDNEKQFLQSIKIIKIKELSEHYVEY